jgi:hypothetical protein
VKHRKTWIGRDISVIKRRLQLLQRLGGTVVPKEIGGEIAARLRVFRRVRQRSAQVRFAPLAIAARLECVPIT